MSSFAIMEHFGEYVGDDMVACEKNKAATVAVECGITMRHDSTARNIRISGSDYEYLLCMNISDSLMRNSGKT